MLCLAGRHEADAGARRPRRGCSGAKVHHLQGQGRRRAVQPPRHGRHPRHVRHPPWIRQGGAGRRHPPHLRRTDGRRRRGATPPPARRCSTSPPRRWAPARRARSPRSCTGGSPAGTW
ncbi:hypothetical protein DAI22_02g128800 [Oryza sativa Japonica Group]|nr:hypothetical protein DAI22_02g128800 [Oryza sativa Japonica Group]